MATKEQIDIIRNGHTEQFTINGGSQTVWKGTVNPGTETRLSFQAMMALVMVATIGQLRPNRINAGAKAYRAWIRLIENAVGKDRVERDYSDRPMFAGLPVCRNYALRDHEMQASVVMTGNKRLTVLMTGIVE